MAHPGFLEKLVVYRNSAQENREAITMLKPIIPDGEALRYAFEWLAEQGHCTLKTVEQASLRFDLTPRDEEFLLRQFVYHRGAASDAQDSGRQRFSG